MKRDIKTLRELGDDWALIGIDGGDQSLITLTKFQQGSVHLVKSTKLDSTSSKVIVYVLVGRAYARSFDLMSLVETLENSGYCCQLTLLPNKRLFDQVTAVHKAKLKVATNS